MNSKSLEDLAKIIGWQLVSDDPDYTEYEFKECTNSIEQLSHIVKIKKDIDVNEVYEIWLILKSVLPRKLRKKLNKISKHVKPEEFSTLFEVVSYTIEDYRAKTDYQKLKEYGLLLGVDIEKLGYEFEYEMSKVRRQKLLSIIESKLPIELAPVFGKMKKLDYKIGYVKQKKYLTNEE